MTGFSLKHAETPLLISVPHAGTRLPPDIADRLLPTAAKLPDTDWFVDELYAFAAGLGAGLLVAEWSRYVVDLNRPPDDGALYATRTTGLVPVETFGGQGLYASQPPDKRECAERVARFWRPFHEALTRELDRIHGVHGHVVLLDAHSIRSRVPELFDGELPHFNLGTHGGRSASVGLIQRAWSVLEAASDYEAVRDGRFQGGFITRHHGRPAQGRHALQLEMAQRTYMREAPPRRDERRRATLAPVLARLVKTLAAWRPV